MKSRLWNKMPYVEFIHLFPYILKLILGVVTAQFLLYVSFSVIGKYWNLWTRDRERDNENYLKQLYPHEFEFRDNIEFSS